MNSDLFLCPLKLWGGHECSLNRVQDYFADQTIRSGHIDRMEDLDRFAELGISALRYPILWEQVSPMNAEQCNWAWHDERLGHIRSLGISPIAGLLHHGSGPTYTNLLDPEFAAGLAQHAGRVAVRYPWINDWTPVNEPLTTARFSALYGHWYPHARDELSFWTALLNQVDATRLAMTAIRAMNSDARLIQTEDLGRSYSTAPLAGQAAFDNERRWASWDLLCGRVIPGHSLWDRLVGFGLGARLSAIADAPCPPDVLGLNHYLTSDRFLDHQTERYPNTALGMCSFGPLADVEAVRVVEPAPAGLAGAIREAWDRYGLPIALTEVHLDCTREEQMRWFSDAWQTARTLRDEKIDIVAVTAWSLLGSFDWASLLTRSDNEYETGLFDVSAGIARPTALAGLVRELGAGGASRSRLIDLPGWWKRPERLAYPSYRLDMAAAVEAVTPMCAPLLILGATGTLGQAFAGACHVRNIPYRLADRAALSLNDMVSIEKTLDKIRPWAVVNCAGWVRVDEAEAHPDACMAVNRDGSLRLAHACAAREIPLTIFSSDLVFDGLSSDAYIEGRPVAPLSVYGRSKAEADTALLALGADILVIRTASFFSPFDRHNFASHVLASLRAGQNVRAAEDCVTSPTYVPDLVRTVLDLMIDGETGLWHLANQGAVSWAGFAIKLAKALKFSDATILPLPQAEMGWAAPRPAFAPLASKKCGLMPELDEAIRRFASFA
ncbi:MAG TPA: SDR family oxidoreductase [Sphingobium sp.]